MLTNLLDGWFKFGVGEGAFYAVFGFVFVFLGITLLILFFTALGKIMSLVNRRRAEKSNVPTVPVKTEARGKREDEFDPQLVAVISAAIAAYYEGENVPCNFVVRRIKKI